MIVTRARAVFYGSLAGALMALALVAILGARAAIDGAVITDGRAEFVVSAGSLFLAVAVFGAIGGILIAGTDYLFSNEAEPDSPRFPLGYLLPVAAVTGALFSYIPMRFGLGMTGDLAEGTITVSVYAMVVIGLIAGIVAGAITTAIVDALARPAFLRLEGEAWPTSGGEVAVHMLRAVGTPLVALVVSALFAVGLAQILLEVEGTGAVIVFSVVATLILGGAALIAAEPWKRNGTSA